MSDIAMLVAEEYERRVKNYKKGGTAGVVGDQGEFNMVSCASSMLVFTRSWLKENNIVGVGKKRDLIVNWVSEPKTQLAVAALNSFFSA